MLSFKPLWMIMKIRLIPKLLGANLYDEILRHVVMFNMLNYT